ncbi:hypothetical protein J7K43_03630 [Candidatus Calescamantes bacterium]|nr:hypothetical protein [Candidatus Calescamantes bacterium]
MLKKLIMVLIVELMIENFYLSQTNSFADTTILTSFEKQEDVKKWSSEWGHHFYGPTPSDFKLVKDHATDGNFSMKIEFPPTKGDDTWWIKGYFEEKAFAINDWSNYDIFAFDVYYEKVDLEQRNFISIWISDKKAYLDADDERAQEGVYRTSVILEQGVNKIKIPIKEISKAIDVKNVMAIKFLIAGGRQKKTLYFDNLRLERKKDVGAYKKRNVTQNGCSLKIISTEGKKKIVMKNKFIRVVVESRGGRISEYLYLPTNHDFFPTFRQWGGIMDYCWITSNPSEAWYSILYKLEITRNSPEIISVTAIGESIVDGFKIRIRRKMSIFKGSTKLLIETECKNLSNKMIKTLFYGLHPELTPGGKVIKDKQAIFIPKTEGIEIIHPVGIPDIKDIKEGWIVAVNQNNQEALKLSFNKNQFEKLHIYGWSADFYNLELFFKPSILKPGETACYKISFSIYEGVNSVREASENLVWNIKPACPYALQGATFPVQIEVFSNGIEEDKILDMRMLSLKNNKTVWKKEVKIPFISVQKPFLDLAEVKGIAEKGEYLLLATIKEQKEVLAEMKEKIKVYSPNDFFIKHEALLKEKERLASLLKKAEDKQKKILNDKKTLEQQIEFLQYKLSKIETSQSVSASDEKLQEKKEIFLGKPPLVGFFPSWITSFKSFRTTIEEMKAKNLGNFIFLQRHERDYSDDEVIEMARLCRENGIYFVIDNVIKSGHIHVNSQKRESHLKNLTYGWRNEETIRKIKEVGGKYYLGIWFGEPANHMGFFDGSGTTEEKCFKEWEEAISDYVKYYKEHFNALPIPQERFTLVPYWYRCGCEWTIPEILEHSANTDVRLAMLRGAKRTYGKPFGVDSSLWFGGTVPPQGGHSLSTFKKSIYLPYVSGANLIMIEGDWNFNSEYIGEMGKLKRLVDELGYLGEPYTPVAVMLSLENGWYPGQDIHSGSWGILPPDKADHMVNTCLNIFYPGYWDSGRFDERTGFFVPTPLGNIDIIWDDIPLEKMKKYYKAVILLGPYKIEGELEEKLKRYVQDGGILAINAAQLNKDKTPFWGLRLTGKKHLSKKTILMPNKILGVKKKESWSEYPFKVLEIKYSKGFTVVARDDKNYPILLTRTFGKGRIWVTTPEYLITVEQPYECLEIAKFLFARIASSFKIISIDKSENIGYMITKGEGRCFLLLMNHLPSPWEGKLKIDKKILKTGRYKITELFSNEQVKINETSNSIIFESKLEGESLKLFKIRK